MAGEKTAQVGGTHYVARYQQWHWAADLSLRYFEGNITRYICRHRKKNGSEDLQKALHWAEELLALTLDDVIWGTTTDSAYATRLTKRLANSYKLTKLETLICKSVVMWKQPDDLRKIIVMIGTLLKESQNGKA